MNIIPNIRAWDEGENEPWKQTYRKPAMLKVIEIGPRHKGILCESKEIMGKGTLAEVPISIALLDPPIMWGSKAHDINNTEIFASDIIMDQANKTYLVEYKDSSASFILKPITAKYELYFHELDISKCEIVGNKHETPELMS